MTIWLIANVLLWLGCWYFYRSIAHTDDFGAGILVLGIGATGAVSSVAYLFTAFWLHRFL